MSVCECVCISLCVCSVFFFQAEDGIRDLVRSRGLGDVYKRQGVVCKDVQSPFPIHGIESLIGVPRTRISIASFLYGLTGTSFALWMTWYMMIYDWPINIGGKPNMMSVSYTHLRAHETVLDLVCRLLLEKKKQIT